MAFEKKRILLKLSGEFFSNKFSNLIKPDHFIDQIKTILKDCSLGIVIGGGNIFRGNQDGLELSLNRCQADEIGMLATIINGKILQAFLKKHNLNSIIFSALACPQIAKLINQTDMEEALEQNKILIFVGGTANPYFSTDTASVIRALQIGASEIWKATKVDGIYDRDPQKEKSAQLIKKISYKEVLEKKLNVMDLTAITLASENNLKIRIFNLFSKDSLINAVKDQNFGSLIHL